MILAAYGIVFSIPMIIWGLIYSFLCFLNKLFSENSQTQTTNNCPSFGKNRLSIFTFRLLQLPGYLLQPASTGEILLLEMLF
jgi:hypothetical protein